MRLLEACEGTAPWRQWGPYLIERQWGTLSVEQRSRSGIGTELPIPYVTVSVAIGGTADRDQPHSTSSIYEDTTWSFEQSVS